MGWYDIVVHHFIILFISDMGHLLLCQLLCYSRRIIIDQIV